MTTSPRTPWLRDYRHPVVWFVVYALMVAFVIVASLAPAQDLPIPLFDGIDKIEHFISYAGLSTTGAMLFARMRGQALNAAALIALGVGLEFMQASMHLQRMGDSADALANALGALAGLLTAHTSLSRWFLWLERQLFAAKDR